jgi:cell division septal protein FtsQ
MGRRTRRVAKAKRAAPGVRVRRTGTRPASRRETASRVRRVAIVSSAAVLLAAIGLVVSLAPGWGRVQGDFVISAIDVKGNTVLTPDEVIGLSGLELGASLLDVRLDEVEEAVARSSRVERARVSRHLPGTIVIRLDEAVPVAFVAAGSGGLAEVAEDGRILEPVERSSCVDLPLVTGATGPVGAGAAPTDAELRRALELLREARRVSPLLWAEFSEVRIAPGSGLIIYTVADGAEVRVGSGALDADGLADLWLVMCDLRARGLVAESIDLRFANQLVVRLSPKSAGGRA